MSFDNAGIALHPGLNLSSLSDEDIYLKLNDLSRRFAFVSNSFGSQEIISQLNTLQNVLLNEQSERMQKERYALEQSGLRRIIESDPDLRDPEVKKDIPIKRDEAKKRTHVPIIIKSWKSPEVKPVR